MDKRILGYVTHLTEEIFAAETRRLGKLLTDLDQQNREMGGHQAQGFLFRGVIYIPPRATVVAGTSKGTKPLAWALNDQMEEYLKDKTQVQNDAQQIRQILIKLADPLSTEQDLRDVLPECVVMLDSNLHRLPRTNTPAFTLADNAQALRQYAKLLPRIEFYAATRLIY